MHEGSKGELLGGVQLGGNKIKFMLFADDLVHGGG